MPPVDPMPGLPRHARPGDPACLPCGAARRPCPGSRAVTLSGGILAWRTAPQPPEDGASGGYPGSRRAEGFTPPLVSILRAGLSRLVVSLLDARPDRPKTGQFPPIASPNGGRSILSVLWSTRFLKSGRSASY